MKSKCTLIFKALISMVLVFILLFGTVATSLAAVVDKIDTGAKVELAESSAIDWWDYNSNKTHYLYYDDSVANLSENGSKDIYLKLGDSSNDVFKMNRVSNSLLYWYTYTNKWEGCSGIGIKAATSKPTGGYSTADRYNTDHSFGGNRTFFLTAEATGTALSISDWDENAGDKGAYMKNDVTLKTKTASVGSDTYTEVNSTIATLDLKSVYPSGTSSITSVSSLGSASGFANGAVTYGGALAAGQIRFTYSSLNAAYEFIGWYDSSGNQLSTSNPYNGYQKGRVGDITYYAYFRVMPTITLSQSGSGTVTIGGSNVANNGTKRVNTSTATAVSITAPTGYYVNSVSGAGWTRTANEETTTVWTGTVNTNANATLTVTYAEITAGIALTAFTNGSASTTGGVIKVNGTAVDHVNGVGISTKATALSVAVTPDYTFIGWQFDGTNISHLKYSFTDGADYTAPANNSTTYGRAYDTIYIKTDGTSGMTTDNAIVKAIFVTSNRTLYAAPMLALDNTGYSTTNASDDATFAAAVDVGTGNDGSSFSDNYTFSVADSDTVYLSANEPAGYRFIGWISTDSSQSTYAISTSVDEDDADHSLTIAYNTDEYWYALYKKIYYLSFYNSTVKDGASFTFVTAPPKTVTATNAKSETTTFSYAAGTQAQRGEDNQPMVDNNVGPFTDNTKTSGTYYEGNKLEVLAGDTIVATYSSLASSDIIRSVLFNNDKRYTTEKEDDDLYVNRSYKASGWGTDAGDDSWLYTYLPDTTLFADPDYFTSETVPADTSKTIKSVAAANTYTGVVDQETHTLTITNIDQNYLNIDLKLASKKEVVFSDTKNIVVNSVHDGNYYSYDDPLSTGDTAVDRLAIYAKGNTEQINNITVANVKCYYYDAESGSYLTALGEVSADPVEVSGITVCVSDGSSTSIANSGSSNSAQYIYLTGNMPAYDVYVAVNTTFKYNVYIGSAIISDTIVHKTYFAQLTDTETGVQATPSTAGETAKKAPDNALYNTTPSVINKGDTVACTYAWLGDWGTYYMFTGWYSGDSSGPDYEHGFLSDKKDYTAKPTANTYLYAVGTRDLYINGSKYITGADDDWHSENNEKSNFKMKFDASKGTQGMYYWTITDEMFEAAGRDFVTKYEKDNSGNYPNSSWTNHDISYYFFGDDGRPYWIKNDATHGNAYFQLFDSATGEDKTIWQNHVYGFRTLASGITYGKILPRDYTGDDRESAARKDGQGFIDFNETKFVGYSTPLTIYFDPAEYALSVESSYIYPNVYVSNGYKGIDTATDASTAITSQRTQEYETLVQPLYNGSVVANGDTGYFDITSQEANSNYGWALSCEGRVYHYKVKSRDASIRVSRKVTKDSYKVASFFVYDIYSDKVRCYGATKGETDASYTDYYCDLTLETGHDLYICPIIESTTANYMKVVIDATQLKTDEWGDFVSCYAWYDSGDANGAFPGQLMIRSDDGKTYTATFPTTSSTSSPLAGITFANYYNGSGQTWLGGSGVLGDNDGIIESGEIIDTYNSIGSGNYNQKNCKVQTYDYREPVAFYLNKGSASSILLTFSLKTGNSGDVMSSRHSELTTATIPGTFVHKNSTNVESNITFTKSNFEYLTDASNDAYVDLNGKTLATKPTASYYVIAKGMATYDSGSLLRSFYSGTNHDDVVGVTYPNVGSAAGATIAQKFAVQWYVYDASGNYITNMMSSGYADRTNDGGDNYTLIAQALLDAGYAVDNRSVMICYDNPRSCNGTGTGAYAGMANKGSSFDAYRLTGQWKKHSEYATATITAKVGMMTDAGEEMAETAASAGYGSASTSVNSSKLSITTVENTTYYGTGTDKNGFATAFTTIVDGEKQAITLTASAANFIGWYYYDDNDELKLASSEVSFKPTYTTHATYYAMYQARATYRYMYTGREGGTNGQYYSVDGGILDSAELALNKVSKVTRTDFGDPAKMPGANAISIFKKTISWNTSVSNDMLDDTTDHVMKITNATVAPETFTLTYYYPESKGGDSTSTGSMTAAYNTVINLSSVNIRSLAADNKVFVGWYEADNEGDATDKLLSTQENYANVLVKDTKIVAVYGDSAYTPSGSWEVYVDDQAVTREMYSAESGKYYNDTIIRVRQNSDNEVTLPSGGKAGILVVDDGGKSSNVINNIPAARLTAFANALNTSGKTGKIGDTGATVTNVFTTTLTKFGRADLATRATYSTHVNHNYAVYAYVYDGSSYTFVTTPETGSYSIYSGN